jgi:hypothetical protein
MAYLELFDETLDINSTGNYEIAVQAGIEGVAFCLLDTIRNKFVLLRSYEPEEGKYFNSDRIRDIHIKDDFLTKTYRKVKLVMPSVKFTIVPASLFDPAKKDEYFSFNHILQDGNIIYSNKISDPDAYLVYPVQKDIADLMESYHPGIQPLHQVKPLLSHISAGRKSGSGYYIHLHREREFFNLVICDHTIMKFCNAYRYRNITDILYFTLNVFRTMGIGQEHTIWLSGMTENHDDLSSNLGIYIRNVKFAIPAGNFTFSYVFSDTARHRYLNLFTAVNCE